MRLASIDPISKALSGPVRGALWMTLSAAIFALLNGVVRYTADLGLHPFQIAFLRSCFAFLLMLPFMLRGGIEGLKTTRTVTYLGRGAAATFAVLCWMTAIAYIPLAEATAISFAFPLVATAGSALLLGEVVRIRRWSAVIIGFLGVLIILRPGFQELGPGQLAAVGAACGMAAASLLIKSLTRTEPTRRVVFYTSLMLTVTTLPFALYVWQPMTLEFWLLGGLLGLFGVMGHLCLTMSFQAADASVVIPLDYTRLPFAALVGYVAFAEMIGPWTWFGAAVIVGSAFYLARRESQLAKEPVKAEPT